MQPQPAESKTPPNVLQFGRARELVASGSDQAAREPALAIHDHELVRPIGRGAYGEVWLAHNALGTCRAIKIVYRKDFEDSRPFEREFAGIQKFEPISRSHPGLVNILQVGRREDYFYYVMELADDASSECGVRNAESGKPTAEPGVQYAPIVGPSSGPIQSLTPHSALRTPHSYTPRTLREDLRQHGRLPAQRCVEIGLALTSALVHLHRYGLVHRDVKPSNLIFVQGAPKLADIGLVTEAGDSRSIVGTEGYLPPEGPGTPQADIFSLGKVLYEISTGQDRRQFPDLPSDIKDWPDAPLVFELNQPILKACAADARQRYQSAEEMRGELALLQRGESVRRRRVWQQRIRALRGIGLAATVVAMLAAGAALLWQTMERHSTTLSAPMSAETISGTQNSEAFQAYMAGLKAMRRGTPKGFSLALEHFTVATKADPQFLAAHARLFEICLMCQDHDIHKAAGGKAKQLYELSANLVKLAPTNAETHAALAIVHFLNEWKWDEAESEFRKALKADPKCQMALKYYGYFLTRLLRASAARPVLEQALQLDPDSPLITKFIGHCEYVQRRYDQALRLYQTASVDDDSYPSAHYWAGRANWALGNYQQALDDFAEHELFEGWLPTLLIREAYQDLRQAFEKDGPRGCWVRRLEGISETRSPYWYAECHARLGHRAEALSGLREAVKQRDNVTNLLVDEFWDDYRKDPEFKEILKKVGLDRWTP